MKKNLFIIAVMFFSFSLFPSDLVRPADTKNMFIYYIPHLFMPQFSSDTAYSRRMFSISVSESNTIMDPVYFGSNGKKARIDVETTCISLLYSEKIFYDIELSASLSLIRHWGGFLDGVIEEFHSLPVFGKGLPNGGREYVEQDEIKIYYKNKGQTVDISNAYSGLSDPSFFVKKNVLMSNAGLYFSVGLKPAIGSKAFINSNTFDLGLSAGADYRKERLYLFGSIAVIKFIGEDIYYDELEQSKKHIYGLCLGGGYRISENTAAIVQLYLHSSVYETGVERLDRITVCNTYAFRWRYNESSVLQFDITEDPFTYATTDITLNVKNETRF